MNRPRRASRVLALSLGVACATPAALGQTAYPENVEPNNDKATATLVTVNTASGTLLSADRLTGTCSTTDTDYWRLKVAPLTPGIYRNVLYISAPPAGTTLTHTIRGLSQAAGVINAASDVSAFTSTVTSTSQRSVSWYGFAKEEELYYSISSNQAGGSAYTVGYNRAAAAVVDATAGTLYTGDITLRVRNVSGNLNTDCWLYDSNLNPLTSDGSGPAGADGNLMVSPPAGTLSSFTRTLGPGTYYLAVAGSNLANNQPSVATDTTGYNLPALELPNALLCGVSTGLAATFAVELTDTAAHTVNSANIVLGASWGGNVGFVKFTVISPALPSAIFSANPDTVAPGGSTTISVSVTPATGGASADITSVSANISALTSTPPTTISLSSSDGGVTWTGLAPVDLATTQGNKTIPFTVVQGGPVPGTLNSSGSVMVGPSNDMCSGAIDLTVGVPSAPVSNQFAGTNDGPAACVSTVGKGVWYRVTPSVTAAYQIDTCGSAINSILTVYQIADCADPGTWSEVGCNDDRPAGACAEAQASAIQNLALFGGTTYYLRVQAFNNSGTFVTGNVIATVTQLATGACCNNSTGECVIQTAVGCATSTTTYRGDNTVCDPTPCVAIGTCCDITSGACRPIFGGSCNGTEAANSATTCEPTPCSVVRVCCNNTSGLCTPMYGGTACAFGTTEAAGSLVCDPTPCIAIGTCCDFVSGNCRPIYGGSCNGTETPSSATACDPTPCVVVRVCCNNVTGLCAPMYGGSACVSGHTEGAGLTCEPTTCDMVRGACCQQQTGTCSLTFSADCAALALPGTFLGRAVVCPGGLCYGEHEPNSTSFAAFFGDPLTNPATLSSGDVITGIATGGGFDAGNNGNGPASNNAVDFWLVSTATQPVGIYRHEMTQIQGSASQGYGLRGRGQSNGAVTGGNAPVQSSAGGTTKMTAWYGFGRQERIILQQFSGSTTPYVYQLTDTPVTPTVATGTLVDGAVTIRVISTGTTPIDSDIWLYDSNLNALTNGANGPGGAEGQLAAGDPAGTTSSFTRTLAPGTYYLAVSPTNLCNDQPNDAAEGITSTGTTTALELSYFPDVVLCSQMNQTIEYAAHVELVDASSNTVASPDLAWTGTWNGLVHFVQFTVGVPTNGACCCGSSCSIGTAAACTGTNRSFAGAGTTCTPYSVTVPCCRGDYNKSGAPGVQDIFDFLAGYFSADPCADANDAGGVSVQDIFDFLAAYFAGGC